MLGALEGTGGAGGYWGCSTWLLWATAPLAPWYTQVQLQQNRGHRSICSGMQDAAAFTHSTAPPGAAAPPSLAHCPPHLLGQQGGLIAVGLISSAAFLPSSL